MEDDGLSAPNCVRCLVPMDAEITDGGSYWVCPQCGAYQDPVRWADELMHDDAMATRVGRIVIAASRLEFELGMLAIMVGAHKQNDDNLGRQFERVRRWTTWRKDADEIAAWSHTSYALLGERHAIVHAHFADTYDAGDTRITLNRNRGWTEVNFESGFLDGLAIELTAAWKKCNEFETRITDESFDRNIDRLKGIDPN